MRFTADDVKKILSNYTLEVLRIYRPVDFSFTLEWWILRGSCVEAVQMLHRRSPRSAILPRIPRPRDIGRASNLRKYHECLAWYQIRPRVEMERMADPGTRSIRGGWSRRAERARLEYSRGVKGGATKGRCTFLRCITSRYTRQLAKACTRAIACSPICRTEQQRPADVGTSADYLVAFPR